MKYAYVFIVALVVMAASCTEGPQGPVGPEGAKGNTGDPGSDSLAVGTITGVIYTDHYETNNDDWAALPLGNFDEEPVVVFFGIANVNGVYNTHDWNAVIYSNGTDGYDVNGIAGYYLLVYDPSKSLRTENYKIRLLY